MLRTMRYRKCINRRMVTRDVGTWQCLSHGYDHVIVMLWKCRVLRELKLLDLKW